MSLGLEFVAVYDAEIAESPGLFPRQRTSEAAEAASDTYRAWWLDNPNACHDNAPSFQVQILFLQPCNCPYLFSSDNRSLDPDPVEDNPWPDQTDNPYLCIPFPS